MRLSLYFALALILTSCGYHLVGQGESNVIPSEVQTAWLESGKSAKGQALRMELEVLWQGNKHLPSLDYVKPNKTHVTVRIEQVSENFIPIG
ncbi:MAG: hypothetical protein Q9M75_00105, partial [Ghiorsea sp.]|nr:hypothetical protein [Ghiorsea sp.]